jgi:polysaccharide biosynthesis transport protein
MKSIENLTVSDYITIFRRRFWYVVVPTILATAATAFYVKQLPSIYRSETTIAINSRFLPEDYIKSIDRQSTADRMDFVRQQLQNRSFLEGIVQEFRLAGPEGFQRAAEVVGSKIEITVFTQTAFKLGFSATDPKLAQGITKRLAERVIQSNDSFRKEKVQVADQFLEEQLKQAADEFSRAEQKLTQFREQAFPGLSEANTPDSSRDLRLQLDKLDAQLEKLDVQLEADREQRKSLERRLDENRQLRMVIKAPPPPAASHAPTPAPQQTVTPAGPTPLETELATKRAQLASDLTRYTPLYPEVVRLTQEVRRLEALVAQESTARQAQAAKAATPVTEPKEEQAQVAPLPELDTLLDLVPVEIQAELDRVNREIEKGEQTKKEIVAKISAYETRLNPPPALSQELGALTRDFDAAKQRYTLLSDRKLTAEMAARADSSESNEMFSVIDQAYLPRLAVGPNRRMLTSLGGLVGLVLGLGFAFLRDYLDPSVHSEEDALAEIKLPVLASIPIIEGEPNDYVNKERIPKIVAVQNKREDSRTFSFWEANGRVRNVVLNPLCMARENYRLLHAQLLGIQQKKGRQLKTILISSSNPNEGKTFSTCCIAGILAKEAGKKVLLIDSDLRKPNVANTLGLRKDDSNYNFGAVLRGEADIEESAIRCDDLNLYVIPAGPASSNPAEMLHSPRFEETLRRAAAAFDWVIVDSPPILAAADVNVISPLVDGMLLVVHSGKTPLKLIQDSVKRVGHDRILGLVMNRVKTTQSGYYSGYSGYYYGAPSRQSSKKSIFETVTNRT